MVEASKRWITHTQNRFVGRKNAFARSGNQSEDHQGSPEGSHCRVGDTVLSARFLMLPGFTEDDPVCRSGYRRLNSNLKTVLFVGLRRAGNTRTAFVFTTGIHYAKPRLVDVHGIPSRFWARLPTQNQNVLDSPLHGLSNCPGCSPSDSRFVTAYFNPPRISAAPTSTQFRRRGCCVLLHPPFHS